MPSVDLGNVVGPQGPAPDITATASVDNNSGTPSVDVTKTGSTATPNFDFAFHNLHGVVDDALSTSSTNPVQNKVVTTALNGKVANTDSRLSDARNLYNATPTSDSTVYLRRQTTGGMCAIKKIVGGSVVKNQILGALDLSGSVFPSGTQASISSGVVTFTGTFDSNKYGYYTKAITNSIKDHIYIISGKYNCTNVSSIWMKVNANSTTSGAGNYTSANRYTVVNKAVANGAAAVIFGWSGAQGASFTVNLSEVNLIDLTQMFSNNPAIADYIYTLEQATAGSGISKLAEWGFDLSVYHAYDAGSLQSVKLAGKYAVGKNKIPSSNGASKTNNGITVSTNGDGIYHISGTSTASAYITFPLRESFIIPSGVNHKLYLNNSFDNNNVKLRFLIDSVEIDKWGMHPKNRPAAHYSKMSNNLCNQIQIWVDGSGISVNGDFAPMIISDEVTDDTYEPYKGSITPLSPTDLRGIYSLDASNNLISDGDEYYPDGGESVSYGIADMGDFSVFDWKYQNNIFYAITSLPAKQYNSNDKQYILCSKYITYSWSAFQSVTIGIAFQNSSTTIRVKDSNYTDLASFKAAMSGVYLIYKKSTPTTAQLSPYQSLESISTDGTEEYIDYGVQQGTRDLAIPPYSSAEYTVGNADNVIASGDVIDGYNNVLREKENHRDLISLLGDDESGRTTASRAYSVNEFFYKDGAVFKVTASIASGAAFTVGTNCTQTTIFAVLTALLNA